MFASMEIANKFQCYMYWLDSQLVLVIASLHSTCSTVCQYFNANIANLRTGSLLWEG